MLIPVEVIGYARLVRLSDAHRRLGKPPPGVTPEQEMELARAAGMRDDQVVATGAAAPAAFGDVEGGRRDAALADGSRCAVARGMDRYERLGLLPRGVTARLT